VGETIIVGLAVGETIMAERGRDLKVHLNVGETIIVGLAVGETIMAERGRDLR
jgi:co-chaperonin GroES (HSP10)